MRPRAAPLGRNKSHAERRGGGEQTARRTGAARREALAGGQWRAARELAQAPVGARPRRLIELLEPDPRVQLVEALGPIFAPEVLSELDEHRARPAPAGAAQGACWRKPSPSWKRTMPPTCWRDLDEAEQQEILAQMPAGERAALERNLEYPEETAGRLMQTDFVAVPPFWTVGQVIDHMREAEDLPETFSDIYVVDPTYHVVGSLDLSRLLRTKRDSAGREHHGRGPRRWCWRPPTRRRWRASSSATTSSPPPWSTPTSAWSAS